MISDDSSQKEPDTKAWKRQMNQGIPTVLLNSECQEFLCQPGFFRALHGYNDAAFRMVYKKGLDNAQQIIEEITNSEKSSAPRMMRSNEREKRTETMKLLAQIVREMDSDPVRLEISVPEKTGKLSYWERKNAEKRFTCWNTLIDILPLEELKGDDWLCIFKSLVNAAEGKERDCGMPLVKAALKRPDMAVQAIESYPKLFRSSRGEHFEGDHSKETALMFIAKGSTKSNLCDFEKSCKRLGAAVEKGVQIVQALQASKVKENGSDLLFASSLADYWNHDKELKNVVFDIFCATHGAENVLGARDSEGYSALGFAVKDNHGLAGGLNKLVEHLLDIGAGKTGDNKMNKDGEDCLSKSLEKLSKSSEILHSFSKRGMISDEQINKFFSNLDAIKDPESKAYISSQQAFLEIENLMASSVNKNKYTLTP